MAGAAERLTWVHHPAREQPGRLIFATGVILGVALSILWADGDVFLAVVAAGVLLASIAPFLLPTRYTLTDREVIEQRPGWSRRRRWADLRRWEEGPWGFGLSPFRAPRGWLDERRSIVLRGGDRDRIREVIARHMAGVGGSEG